MEQRGRAPVNIDAASLLVLCHVKMAPGDRDQMPTYHLGRRDVEHFSLTFHMEFTSEMGLQSIGLCVVPMLVGDTDNRL